MRDTHRRGFSRATVSGDSWACVRAMIGTSDGKPHKTGTDWKWNYYFPRLNIDLDRRLRRGYSGGVNISRHKGINRGEMTHVDIHNSYGSVMYGCDDEKMPFGIPTLTHEEPPERCRWIGEMRIKLKLKPGAIPWFSFKNGIDYIIEGWQYGTLIEETAHYHDMTLTDVDVKLLSEWYDIEHDPDFERTYFVFKTRVGLLRPYID